MGKNTPISAFRFLRNLVMRVRKMEQQRRSAAGTADWQFFSSDRHRYCLMADTKRSVERNSGPLFSSRIFSSSSASTCGGGRAAAGWGLGGMSLRLSQGGLLSGRRFQQRFPPPRVSAARVAPRGAHLAAHGGDLAAGCGLRGADGQLAEGAEDEEGVLLQLRRHAQLLAAAAALAAVAAAVLRQRQRRGGGGDV
jgi:hypothetical protein